MNNPQNNSPVARRWQVISEVLKTRNVGIFQSRTNGDKVTCKISFDEYYRPTVIDVEIGTESILIVKDIITSKTNDTGIEIRLIERVEYHCVTLPQAIDVLSKILPSIAAQNAATK